MGGPDVSGGGRVIWSRADSCASGRGYRYLTGCVQTETAAASDGDRDRAWAGPGRGLRLGGRGRGSKAVASVGLLGQSEDE